MSVSKIWKHKEPNYQLFLCGAPAVCVRVNPTLRRENYSNAQSTVLSSCMYIRDKTWCSTFFGDFTKCSSVRFAFTSFQVSYLIFSRVCFCAGHHHRCSYRSRLVWALPHKSSPANSSTLSSKWNRSSKSSWGRHSTKRYARWVEFPGCLHFCKCTNQQRCVCRRLPTAAGVIWNIQ